MIASLCPTLVLPFVMKTKDKDSAGAHKGFIILWIESLVFFQRPKNAPVKEEFVEVNVPAVSWPLSPTIETTRESLHPPVADLCEKVLEEREVSCFLSPGQRIMKLETTAGQCLTTSRRKNTNSS